MTLFLMTLTHTYLMLWKAMYIHWSLYGLMFTGFEILLPPLCTCLMAFPVQAHCQVAPTFPLSRTLSLMPLGPGLLFLLSTDLAPCEDRIFISIFPLASNVKLIMFSTSKTNCKKKCFGKCQGWNCLLIWKRWATLHGRDPWANDSCVLCWGVI